MCQHVPLVCPPPLPPEISSFFFFLTWDFCISIQNIIFPRTLEAKEKENSTFYSTFSWHRFYFYVFFFLPLKRLKHMRARMYLITFRLCCRLHLHANWTLQCRILAGALTVRLLNLPIGNVFIRTAHIHDALLATER